MDNMQIFSYNGSAPRKLRVVTVAGAPWVILSDMCKILNVSNTTQLARKLMDDERRYLWLWDLGSRLEYHVINEKGLCHLLHIYALLPGMERIEVWIQEEVLPKVNRKGGFPASVLHETLESRAVDKPKQEQPARPPEVSKLVQPIVKSDKPFVVPLAQIDKATTPEVLRAELLLRIADRDFITNEERRLLTDLAIQELTGKKLSDIAKPKAAIFMKARNDIMDLPEVLGFVTRSRTKTTSDCYRQPLYPAATIADYIGVPVSKLNSFAERHNRKRCGTDGFWLKARTPEGEAREFMYNETARDFFFNSAAQIQSFCANSLAISA